MPEPLFGAQYTFPLDLVDAAQPSQFVEDPDLEAGDVQVSKDYGAYVNIATLPTVAPAGSSTVQVTVSAAEMTVTQLTRVRFRDQFGGQWQEVVVSIVPTAASVDQVATTIGVAGAGLSAVPDLAGVTTLLGRLSAARAGYLDNINNATLAGATFPSDPADQSLVVAATNAIMAAVSALNNLDAAGVRAAVGLASANLDTQLAAIASQTDDIGVAGAGLTAVPWNAAWDAEVQSEAADALNAYDPPTGAELTSAAASVLSAIAALNNLAAGAAMTLTAGERTAIADAMRARQLTEGYAADGVAPTLEQALCMLLQGLLEFGVVGTSITTRRLDKSTTAMVHSIDDAEAPTSRTRAS